MSNSFDPLVAAPNPAFVHAALRAIEVFARHTLGDMTALYTLDRATGQMEWSLLPTERLEHVVPRRTNLDDDIQVAGQKPEGRAAPWLLEPLVHLKLREQDSAGPYAPGITLRHPAGPALRFAEQRLERTADRVEIITLLRAEGPLAHECEHRVWHFADEPGVRVATVFRNASDRPLTLQLLTSFSLGGLTPFADDDAPERLWFHRSRSWWSGEGRMESTPLEALHLERSWGTSTLRVERFGQVGSLPVRKFFPFAALEDRAAGVVWAAQLAAPGSWQIEVGRRGDTVGLCGGQADWEFGHWMKTIPPGDTFTTHEALLTAAATTVDFACHRLTALHRRARLAQPSSERELPIVCNEWCTSWGNPSHENLARMARRLHGTPVKYLVIDAGWYRPDEGDWGASQGDWVVSTKLYPHGLKAALDAIRAQGLVPGIWFEFETVGIDSAAAKNESAHLLQLDGRPLTAGTRRFWDFRDPWVTDYLTRRVIDFLREHGFGYMKVDYNESLGLGADGAESLGECLRAHLAGVQQFFRAILAALPDLVIENCASGGHRLEPSFLQLTAVSSSSDAHECLEIPVLCAEQLTQLLPEQNLIWAVVRRGDDERRLAYSLAACFLGRLCLSGDITELSDERWAFVQTALALYREAAPAIRDGVIRRHGERSSSHRHPRGWQAVTFATPELVLAVIHTFADTPTSFFVPLPKGDWCVAKTFPAHPSAESELRTGALQVNDSPDFTGRILLLRPRLA
ncbi:MAG: alpha-galactosidase [Burkholderiales bacterium]|nr:alpha-galactosidase [Opitutaceae bacterium]